MAGRPAEKGTGPRRRLRGQILLGSRVFHYQHGMWVARHIDVRVTRLTPRSQGDSFPIRSKGNTIQGFSEELLQFQLRTMTCPEFGFLLNRLRR